MLEAKVRGGKIFFICCFTLMILQGCDQISSLFGGFSKSKSSKSVKESYTIKQSQAPVVVNMATAEAEPEKVVEPKPSQPSPPPAPVSKNEKPTNLPENIVARVGNWSITLDEFNQIIADIKKDAPDFDASNLQQKRMILEELTGQQLLVQDAEKTGLAQRKDIAKRVEDFRRTELVKEMANKLTTGVEATEPEAEEYYKRNQRDFVEPAKWRVREIVVPTEDEAKAILVELYKGADFMEMVKQKSKSKSAWKKGDLGFLTTFDFPKMESVVKALEIGDISSVFKGPEGFYIVKLEDKQGGEPKKFADIKDEVKKWLTFLKQREAILDYLNKLRETTPVEINEKLLGG